LQHISAASTPERSEQTMGQAITTRYLDANMPHVQQLLDWIRELFIS
jgi:hypothetical protein